MGGIEILILLGILLAKAQKALSPQGAAANAAQAAKEASDAAHAATARGDHATAAAKHAEAAQHAKTAATASKAARTPPPWPQAVPAELPPYPSAAWKPASPVTSAMSVRAMQLLPELWKYGEGTWKLEKAGDRWTVFRATAMGEKRGVVAYTTEERRSVAPAPTPYYAPSAQNMTPATPAAAATHAAAPTVLVPASSSSPTEITLRQGARGPSVVYLQQHLNMPADGVFGPATLAAVKHFQSTHGLVADGVVGPKTWAALGVTRTTMAA